MLQNEKERFTFIGTFFLLNFWCDTVSQKVCFMRHIFSLNWKQNCFSSVCSRRWGLMIFELWKWLLKSKKNKKTPANIQQFPSAVNCLKRCRKQACGEINDVVTSRVTQFLEPVLLIYRVKKVWLHAKYASLIYLSIFCNTNNDNKCVRNTSDLWKLMIYSSIFRGEKKYWCYLKALSVRALSLEHLICSVFLNGITACSLCRKQPPLNITQGEMCAISRDGFNQWNRSHQKHIGASPLAVIYLDWVTRPQLMPVLQMKCPHERPWKSKQLAGSHGCS